MLPHLAALGPCGQAREDSAGVELCPDRAQLQPSHREPQQLGTGLENVVLGPTHPQMGRETKIMRSKATVTTLIGSALSAAQPDSPVRPWRALKVPEWC